MDVERAFGYPVEIRPGIAVVSDNDVVPCRVSYPPDRDFPPATKGVLYVTPRVHLSFPIGIIVAFDEEVDQIKVPNNTPGVQVEEMTSVGWGLLSD
jgi:hypothetical protein